MPVKVHEKDGWTRFRLPNGEDIWVSNAPPIPWPTGTEREIHYGGYNIVLSPDHPLSAHVLVDYWSMDGRLAPNIKTHIHEIIREYSVLHDAFINIETERTWKP